LRKKFFNQSLLGKFFSQRELNAFDFIANYEGSSSFMRWWFGLFLTPQEHEIFEKFQAYCKVLKKNKLFTQSIVNSFEKNSDMDAFIEKIVTVANFKLENFIFSYQTNLTLEFLDKLILLTNNKISITPLLLAILPYFKNDGEQFIQKISKLINILASQGNEQYRVISQKILSHQEPLSPQFFDALILLAETGIPITEILTFAIENNPSYFNTHRYSYVSKNFDDQVTTIIHLHQNNITITKELIKVLQQYRELNMDNAQVLISVNNLDIFSQAELPNLLKKYLFSQLKRLLSALEKLKQSDFELTEHLANAILKFTLIGYDDLPHFVNILIILKKHHINLTPKIIDDISEHKKIKVLLALCQTFKESLTSEILNIFLNCNDLYLLNLIIKDAQELGIPINLKFLKKLENTSTEEFDLFRTEINKKNISHKTIEKFSKFFPSPVTKNSSEEMLNEVMLYGYGS